MGSLSKDKNRDTNGVLGGACSTVWEINHRTSRVDKTKWSPLHVTDGDGFLDTRVECWAYQGAS